MTKYNKTLKADDEIKIEYESDVFEAFQNPFYVLKLEDERYDDEDGNEHWCINYSTIIYM